jgi:hypothetical protein
VQTRANRLHGDCGFDVLFLGGTRNDKKHFFASLADRPKETGILKSYCPVSRRRSVLPYEQQIEADVCFASTRLLDS